MTQEQMYIFLGFIVFLFLTHAFRSWLEETARYHIGDMVVFQTPTGVAQGIIISYQVSKKTYYAPFQRTKELYDCEICYDIIPDRCILPSLSETVKTVLVKEEDISGCLKVVKSA